MRAGARTSSSNTTSSSNRRDWNRSWSGGPRSRRFHVPPPEAAFLQLIDEHHHVRPAGEHLGTELARLERTEVQERLEDSELAGREPLLADPDLEAALERRSTAHQLDQGVERAHLGSVSLVVCAQSNPPAVAGIIQLGIS